VALAEAPAIIIPQTTIEIASKLPPATFNAQENADYRGWIADREQYEDYRAAFRHKAETDVHWWMANYCWTKDPKWHAGVPHVPFVPYSTQRRYVDTRRRMRAAGRPHLCLKSREQGASLCMMYDNQHHWQFSRTGNIKVGSESEKKVDGRGGFAGTLFGKLRYNIERQPEYLLPDGWNPKKHDIQLNITNPETGNTFTGEGTNEHFAVGDRQDGIDIDEATMIMILEQIHQAIGNATRAWSFLSTPRGYEYFAKLALSGKIHLFTMPWWENEAWFGYKDSLTGKFVPGKLYKCKAGCPAHPDGGKPHSDRFDAECESYGWDSVKIASELDLSFSKSGGSVFSAERVNRVLVHVKDRLDKGKLELMPYSLELIPRGNEGAVKTEFDLYIQMRSWTLRAMRVANSNLKVYKLPFSCREKTCCCGGTGQHVYIVSGDTSQGRADGDGAGAMVWDCTAGHVAALLHGRYEPIPLAHEVYKLSRWYGRDSGNDIDALCGVEANGDGFVVNDVLNKLGARIFRSPKQDRHGKEAPRGVVVSRNKVPIINKYLVPYINGDASEWPEFLCVFPEVWQQFMTFISTASKRSVLAPDSMKMGAQYGHHDDLVMMACHALYVSCETYQGRISGVLRGPEVRSGIVRFNLQSSPNGSLNTTPRTLSHA
jgi:hypothetical protein